MRFILILTLLYSCGEFESFNLSKKEIESIKAQNDLSSLTLWEQGGGTPHAPKYIGLKKDGTKYVVKPQVIDSDVLEISYLALSLLYDNKDYHSRPLNIIYDDKNKALLTEFIPGQTIEERKSLGEWTDQDEKEYQSYIKKIDELELVDLHSENVMFIDKEGWDKFYVIDTSGTTKLSKLHLNTLYSLRIISWYKKKSEQSKQHFYFFIKKAKELF
jgi:hypothetical protein